MSVYIDGMTAREYNDLCKWAKIGANNCMIGDKPCVEVPDHGRLIDAEEEIEVWDVCAIEGVFPHIKTTVSKFLLGHCIGKIPPTIIEAEGEE